MLDDRHTTLISSTQFSGRLLRIVQGAWLAVFLTAVIVFAAGVPYSFEKASRVRPETVAEMARLGLPESFPAFYMVGIDILTLVVFGGFSLLIFWQRNDDWMALFVGMLLTLTAVIYSSPVYDAPVPLWIPALLVAGGETCQALFVYLFPDGRWVPRRAWLLLPVLAVWRPLMWIVWYLPGYRIVFPTLTVEIYGTLEQNTLDIVAFLVILFIGIGMQVHRYRRISNVTEKAQARWLLYGMTTAVIVVGSYVLIFNTLQLTQDVPFLVAATGRLIRQLALSLVPAALAVAILRYRLWDIDFVINRSLVYGALTLFLIGLSGGVFLGVRALLISLLGGRTGAVAGAAAAVAVIGLFQPTRVWLRRLVDRRLYGIKLDYYGAAKAYASLEKELSSAARPRLDFADFGELVLVGQGGMGEVYRTSHPRLRDTVAVKLMPLTLASKPLLRARFLHEGAILARLKHPNVIRLLDQGEHEGILFMALEYISGYDLRQRLSESGPIPLQDLLPYLRQLAEALDYIHSEGIVHRDVKPANVILQVEEDGPVRRVVLGDFGIARDLSEEIDPFPSDIVGTLDYIAPEQIQAVGDIDRRADIYALGVMTFELLTGRLPFQKTHPGALILAHLREPAPDPLEINPALTPSAGAAIMRAMIKEREARYVSASDFVEALGRE